jgi:hypothetical protein
MLNHKFILIFFSFLVLCLCSCKKEDYETLPELDLGNNMNPASGTEYVKLDSTRVYNNTTKILKSYVSIDANAISAMGFTWSRINVYKNGYNGTYLSSILPNKVFLDNVVSGQIIKFEFTVVDINGRESKKSKPFTVTIP